MKKLALALAAVLLAAAVSDPALAHGRRGGRVTLGLHIGVPIGWHAWHYAPPYYYAPYYAPAPVVVSPPAPQVYIERGAAPSEPAPASQWWHYCADARAYYPYVKECPGGWQRVAPQPPAN